MSSAFSGIGGPENALGAIFKGLERYTGQVTRTQNCFVFDMRAECRTELRMPPTRQSASTATSWTCSWTRLRSCSVRVQA
eukprot:9228427-Alexandrium_andersonii.AAC.1